jgi:hypothetical protein
MALINPGMRVKLGKNAKDGYGRPDPYAGKSGVLVKMKTGAPTPDKVYVHWDHDHVVSMVRHDQLFREEEEAEGTCANCNSPHPPGDYLCKQCRAKL